MVLLALNQSGKFRGLPCNLTTFAHALAAASPIYQRSVNLAATLSRKKTPLHAVFALSSA